MNYIEHLMHRARSYWGDDKQLPTTLFSEMLAAGIDVEAAENDFHNTHEQDDN